MTMMDLRADRVLPRAGPRMSKLSVGPISTDSRPVEASLSELMPVIIGALRPGNLPGRAGRSRDLRRDVRAARQAETAAVRCEIGERGCRT